MPGQDKPSKAILAGTTGLVGGELLKLLVADPAYDRIVVISRRILGIRNPKVEEYIISFDRLEEYRQLVQGHDAFCCLGTTMKKAGSRENFTRVDFNYVHDFARIAASNGVERFFLVSSMGADKNSSIFYNRVKGEAEECIRDLGFKAVYIFRPSLLLGPRQEKRTGEEMAKKLVSVLDPLIPAKYKGIEASQVARAMMQASSQKIRGIRIYPSQLMRKMLPPAG